MIVHGLVRGFPHHHQSIWILEWKRSQQNCVYNAENRRIRANSQSQRDNADSGKDGIFEQHPEAESQILNESFHCRSLQIRQKPERINSRFLIDTLKSSICMPKF